jgi:hypothetical protein
LASAFTILRLTNQRGSLQNRLRLSFQRIVGLGRIVRSANIKLVEVPDYASRNCLQAEYRTGRPAPLGVEPPISESTLRKMQKSLAQRSVRPLADNRIRSEFSALDEPFADP